MPRHLQHLEIHTAQLPRCRLRDHQLGREILHIQRKAESPEKIRLGHHLHRLRVAPHGAAVLPLDARPIPHMIDVPMGQQQQPHLVSLRRQPIRRFLRRIDQNPRLRQEKTIRLEHPAGKAVYDHRVVYEARYSMGKAFAAVKYRF